MARILAVMSSESNSKDVGYHRIIVMSSNDCIVNIDGYRYLLLFRVGVTGEYEKYMYCYKLFSWPDILSTKNIIRIRVATSEKI